MTIAPSIHELLVSADRHGELRHQIRSMPTWEVSERELYDLELLLCGAFSPLTGFMGERDYESVCKSMRTTSGHLWPIPITLSVSEAFAQKIAPQQTVALRNTQGTPLAVLTVSDIFRPDRRAEAELVYGSSNLEHSGVAALMQSPHPVAIGGTIEGLTLPLHFDFPHLRHTPRELRAEFKHRGWNAVVAFQTRNPIHRAHAALVHATQKELGAALLIHPVVGSTQPGDIDPYTRVRCYQKALPTFDQNTTMLSLLPLAMRMAGPREALWHALIRKNYGCTHFIVGRDHAGPGKDSAGTPFYSPYEAQALVKQHEAEIGIGITPFEEFVYLEKGRTYVPISKVPPTDKALTLSGTELRTKLLRDEDIPDWFSYPEVVAELKRSCPPPSRQGLTIFFTGLSGSGKSTLANLIAEALRARGGRVVSVLDGDSVRKNLSSELGFSKEHRDLNIRRIGYVASEISRARGIAICAAIAPYEKIRAEVRADISQHSHFILVYLSTRVEACESRDIKGLYAKARRGELPNFTGISDPYEPAANAEIKIDTETEEPYESARRIIDFLERKNLI